MRTPRDPTLIVEDWLAMCEGASEAEVACRAAHYRACAVQLLRWLGDEGWLLVLAPASPERTAPEAD